MKKLLLIVSALFFSIFGFSQGIEFEHGTWKELLEKSRQTNKPIFIDVYTSWCAPCKQMSNDIFPLVEVGKVYNANFVCYKIDAEKGEGIEIATQFDNYLQLIPEKDRTSLYIYDLYMQLNKDFKTYSFAFSNLITNRNKFDVKFLETIDGSLQAGIIYTVREAAESKDEQMLVKAIKAFDQSPRLPHLIDKEELYMEYYEILGENEKCLQHGIDFCNNIIMKLSTDSIFKIEELKLQSERDYYSGCLSGIAYRVFERESDINKLQNALSWTARSLELTPNVPIIMEIYANLLYKLGRKEEAIAKEEEAIRYAEKEDTTRFEKTLLKMKAGEKTWQ